MFADTDWAVFVPQTITALGVPIVALFTLRTQRAIKRIEPQVQAIDMAVNGQPAGTEHMVDNVRDIRTEQTRVAEELAHPSVTHGSAGDGSTSS